MPAIKEAKLKSEMTELVTRMYAETERYIQPMPPFLLVRTLPRSTVTAGGILMPEKQNKPNIESVVLAVYEPYWEVAETRVREDGKTEDVSVLNTCDIKVGDHIIHPHHVGLPDTFLDEREYRLIAEDDAIAVLHYQKKNWLRDELYGLADDIGVAADIIDKILENYDLVPKVIYSRTTSGK